MKNHSTHILLMVSFCTFALLWSCNENKENKTNDITFDTISVSKVYNLRNDSTAPSCSLKLTYIAPVKYISDSVLKKIENELNIIFFDDEVYSGLSAQQAADQYAENFIENYKEEAASLNNSEDHSEDLHGGEYYYSIYKTIEGQILFNKADILSYQRISMDYKGNKNSSTIYRNIVFNLKSGKVLTEKDIFIPDYKELLNNIVLYKILEQNNAKSPNDLIGLGFWLDDFSTNNNFYVDEKGITYIFNEDEYASRTNGKITVFVPYSDIEDILRLDSPISRLAGK